MFISQIVLSDSVAEHLGRTGSSPREHDQHPMSFLLSCDELADYDDQAAMYLRKNTAYSCWGCGRFVQSRLGFAESDHLSSQSANVCPALCRPNLQTFVPPS